MKPFTDPIEQYIDDNRMLSKPDIQKLLKISRSTLARRINTGQFIPPTIKQNGRSYWRFKDYQDWSNKHLLRRR